MTPPSAPVELPQRLGALFHRKDDRFLQPKERWKLETFTNEGVLYRLLCRSWWRFRAKRPNT